MTDRSVEQSIDVLCQRACVGGGFANQREAPYRPDATAWAITALAAMETNVDLVDAARTRLAADQHGDGRVGICPENPGAYWPTSVALLAWQGSPKHHTQMELGARFLLSAHGTPPLSGLHAFPPPPPGGWPWVAGTYTWVEPTALTLLALRSAGYSGHQRCGEAEGVLMERQLPHGGWNYGNTVVYGQELRPQPDVTGLALAALAGRVPRDEVKKSIGYLRERIAGVRTPLSLSWALLGLGAWGERPESARGWIAESIALQERYGDYDTTLLSLLLLACVNTGWPGK